MSFGIFDVIRGYGEKVKIGGSFRPNGASGLVAGQTKGRGYSVARVAAGQLRITFDSSKKFYDLDNFECSVQTSDGQDATVKYGAYDATNRNLDIYVYQQKPGFLALPLAEARLLSANDVIAIASSGGLLAKNTDPIFDVVNAGTDQAMWMRWAATSVIKVAWSVVLPPDIDSTVAPSVNFLARMSAGNDTPVLTVEAFAGIGGSNLGASTAALSSTLAKKTATLTGGVAYPSNLAITVVPGTHNTDAVQCVGAWLEYQKSLLVDLASNANNRIHFEATFKNTSTPNK